MLYEVILESILILAWKYCRVIIIVQKFKITFLSLVNISCVRKYFCKQHAKCIARLFALLYFFFKNSSRKCLFVVWTLTLLKNNCEWWPKLITQFWYNCHNYYVLVHSAFVCNKKKKLRTCSFTRDFRAFEGKVCVESAVTLNNLKEKQNDNWDRLRKLEIPNEMFFFNL